MVMSFNSIAIDGPSASGKSTIAKLIADELGYLYVDTGAMYRAFTYGCIINNIDPKDKEKSCSLIGKLNIEFNDSNKITLDGVDVSKEIRSTIVADNVSYIASYTPVRIELIRLQREIAKNHNVVMDGRDIGSFVLPDAKVKIFQVANAEERANRRYRENLEKGIECSYEEILANVKKRDYIDSHREYSPLVEAEDSVRVDTTYMSIEEVKATILKIIKDKGLIQWVLE